MTTTNIIPAHIIIGRAFMYRKFPQGARRAFTKEVKGILFASPENAIRAIEEKYEYFLEEMELVYRAGDRPDAGEVMKLDMITCLIEELEIMV